MGGIINTETRKGGDWSVRWNDIKEAAMILYYILAGIAMLFEIIDRFDKR